MEKNFAEDASVFAEPDRNIQSLNKRKFSTPSQEQTLAKSAAAHRGRRRQTQFYDLSHTKPDLKQMPPDNLVRLAPNSVEHIVCNQVANQARTTTQEIGSNVIQLKRFRVWLEILNYNDSNVELSRDESELKNDHSFIFDRD